MWNFVGMNIRMIPIHATYRDRYALLTIEYCTEKAHLYY